MVWLEHHFPDRKEKGLHQVRSTRGGVRYESQFGRRMTGSGIHAEKITQMFEIAVRRSKLNGRRHELSTANFRRPQGDQLDLF